MLQRNRAMLVSIQIWLILDTSTFIMIWNSVLPSVTDLVWDSCISDASHDLSPHGRNLAHFSHSQMTIFLMPQVFCFCRSRRNRMRNGSFFGRSGVIFRWNKQNKIKIFRGSAPHPAKGAYSAPRFLSWWEEGLLPRTPSPTPRTQPSGPQDLAVLASHSHSVGSVLRIFISDLRRSETVIPTCNINWQFLNSCTLNSICKGLQCFWRSFEAIYRSLQWPMVSSKHISILSQILPLFFFSICDCLQPW